MLYGALQKAKKTEDKKVAVNIQVPSLLKEKFDELCKEEGVSMTALICALMESAIEEKTKNSFYKTDTMELVEKLEQHIQNYDGFGEAYEKGVDPEEIGVPTGNWEMFFDNERAIINAIKTELENRGRRPV